MTPFHHIGDFLRELFLQVPLGAARALFLILLSALFLWVLFLPSRQVTPPEDSGRPGENLKVWAALALLIQIIVYAVL